MDYHYAFTNQIFMKKNQMEVKKLNYNLIRDFNCSNNTNPNIIHLAKMTYISFIDASINIIQDIIYLMLKILFYIYKV